MSLRTASLLLLVVAGLADEPMPAAPRPVAASVTVAPAAAPAPADSRVATAAPVAASATVAPAAAPVPAANETSSAWSNFVYCKCGLSCVKQMGSWYIFELGQSCACQACPEESADATGHLRGSQVPSEDAKAEKPETATTATKPLKPLTKSLESPEMPENQDSWEGASVRGSNTLYCKCGKKCEYGRQLGLYTYYCFRYGCKAC